MAIIGIDLGTTNSLVATFKDGESKLIENEFGEHLTPSVVHIKENGEVIVGKVAKELLIVEPENTVSVFKRSMGLEKTYTLRGKKYRPEELSAFVIKKLVEDAKKILQEEIEEVVISVPAYFDDVRRKATKRAGEIAGVKVERLINEPSAAALACRMEETNMEAADDDSVYMVFDFGGGTLDISIVECFDNVISVNAVSGDNHLGGSDFDNVIATYICSQLGQQFTKLNREARGIVLRKAEQLKIKLSEENEATIDIEAPDISGTVALSHDKLVEISSKIFNRIKGPIRKVLNDSEFGLEDIEKVVLVGGSSRMTVVSMYLYYLLNKELYISGDPDETVAMGLGYYTGMKGRDEALKEMVMTDICPFSLGVDTHNKYSADNPFFCPIIERNSVLPISKVEYLTTVSDFQSVIEVSIYQGDEQYAQDNVLLGKMEVKVKPRRAGKEIVEIRFTYDINGILDVDAIVQSSQMHYQKTIINRELKLTKKDIQKQLEEMSKLKVKPEDKEENLYVLNLGKALYRQSIGETREYIASLLQYFERVLKNEGEEKIAHVRKRIMIMLSNVEAGLFDFYFNEEEFEAEEYEEERNFLNILREREEDTEQEDHEQVDEEIDTKE